MRILVTGGAGYIGSHFCKAAAQAGHAPVVYDDLSTGHREFVKWGPLVQGDIRDTRKVSEALTEHKVDAVVHFAAKSLVAESMKFPELYDNNNRLGTKSVLAAMRLAGVGRFVFSSSAATYGVADVPRIREDHPQKPVNPYGQSKLDSEMLVRDTPAIKSALLRYFNVIGHDPGGELFENHNPETHLLPNILKGLKEGKTFELFGTDYPTPDGTAVRDYVDVNDLGLAHLRALERLEKESLLVSNVGSGRGYSVREVFDTFAKVVGRAPKLAEKPRRPGDPPQLVADDSYFRTWYQGSMRGLEESIRSLVKPT
ncbi:MAG: UDP-glucose 4-epimerase GalE [Bdellovibrionia bacterium]